MILTELEECLRFENLLNRDSLYKRPTQILVEYDNYFSYSPVGIMNMLSTYEGAVLYANAENDLHSRFLEAARSNKYVHIFSFEEYDLEMKEKHLNDLISVGLYRLRHDFPVCTSFIYLRKGFIVGKDISSDAWTSISTCKTKLIKVP